MTQCIPHKNTTRKAHTTVLFGWSLSYLHGSPHKKHHVAILQCYVHFANLPKLRKEITNKRSVTLHQRGLQYSGQRPSYLPCTYKEQNQTWQNRTFYLISSFTYMYLSQAGYKVKSLLFRVFLEGQWSDNIRTQCSGQKDITSQRGPLLT